MRPNQRMNADWGRYPELEDVAERGSASAATSGLLLAALIVMPATVNLLVCDLGQLRTRELLVKVDLVSGLIWPHSTDQVPGRNG